MDGESSSARTRLLGIEGTRAIAALSIVVYHVWLFGAVSSPHGLAMGPWSKFFFNLQAGVTLFFVLSGFLLYRPFAAAVIRAGPAPVAWAYLRNRALRILPAYWAILLAVALLIDHRLLRDPLTLLANLLFAQNYWPHSVMTGIIPAWSLANEVIFYLLLPLLGGAAILVRRAGASPITAAVVPVLALAALGLASKGVERLAHLGLIWQSAFPIRADWFAAGMGLAVVRILWEDGRLHFGRKAAACALAGAAVVAAGGLSLYYKDTLTAVEYQTPIAVACALLLACIIFAPPRAPHVRVLTWRPMFALGLASYSLFLWHFPLEAWLLSHGVLLDGNAGFLPNLAIVTTISVAASAATYLWVERPALSRKRTWQAPAVPSPADGPEPARDGASTAVLAQAASR